MRTLIGAAALALAIGNTVPAHAIVNVGLAVPGSFEVGYATPQLILSKSAPATFVNLDIQDHDIRSAQKRPNNQPWFLSDVISAGETSTIEGLDTTPNGEYGFFCVVHPSMIGTATVMD